MAKKNKVPPTNLVVFNKQETVVSVKEVEAAMPNLSFDDFWATKAYPQSLKEVVRKHFEKRGFIASGKFEDGIKDFGLT